MRQPASYKIYKRGTHRCASPLETIEKISRFLPIFGITRVANITGLDNVGIPVAMVVRPNSRSLSVSQGKGRDLISAKVSGLMESIETYHAERIFQKCMFLSYEDIIYNYNTLNIEDVSRSNKKDLRENTKILWCQATDIINEREIWVPHALVHTDYTYPASSDHGYFITDTNGLASGNSRLEAINHALCEVIERDALALWCATTDLTRNKNKIDPNTIIDDQCRTLIKQLENANINFGLWDITTDIGVPTFICKIASKNEYQQSVIRPSYGSGTHMDRSIALSRAITEAAQSRLTFIAGSRDDQSKKIYNQYFSLEEQEQWSIELNQIGASKRFEDCISYEYESLDQDHDHLLKSLQKIGIRQIACVDLTRENIGIPVVKVIIPGIESMTDAKNRVYGQRMKKFIDSQVHI